jgi:hypothetical protein
MALINNGQKRGSRVIVEKYAGEVLESGYPKIYNALLSFPGYASVTSQQLAEMSLLQYNTRMDAFQEYVEGVEAGSNFSSDLVAGFERRIFDNTTCPRGW